MYQGPKRGVNDVSIGVDRWLALGVGPFPPDRAVAIDPGLAALEPLWSWLESACVARCCGMDAFDFSPPHVQEAGRHLGAVKLIRRLRGLREFVAAQDADALTSERLNTSFGRRAFLELVDHLLANLG